MTEQEVVELARKNYSGPLLAGEDLMVFRVGREGVSVAKYIVAFDELAQPGAPGDAPRAARL